MACKGARGEGGQCLRSNVQYQMDCQLCPEGAANYIGESNRNLYTRCREHMKKFESKKTKAESFIDKHQIKEHAGGQPNFKAKVTGVFKDTLSRQVSEGVAIRHGGLSVLNSKSEWHQPPLWRVISEIVQD